MNKNLTKIQGVFALAIAACCLTACPKPKPKYDPLEKGPVNKNFYLEKATIEYTDSAKETETYIADTKYFMSKSEEHYDICSLRIWFYDTFLKIPFIDEEKKFNYEYDSESHTITFESPLFDSDSSYAEYYMSDDDNEYVFMMDLHLEYLKDQGDNGRVVTYTYSNKYFEEFGSQSNFGVHYGHADNVYFACNYFEPYKVINSNTGLEEDFISSEVQYLSLKQETDGLYFTLRDSKRNDIYRTEIETYFLYGANSTPNNILHIAPVNSSDCQIDFGTGWIIKEECSRETYIYRITFTYNGHTYTFNSAIFFA